MKFIFKLLLLLFIPFFSDAQLILSDSLVNAYKNAANDSMRFALNRRLLSYYVNTNLDSALKYAEIGVQIAQKNNMKLAEAVASSTLAWQLQNKGRYAESLKYYLSAFTIAENPEIEKSNEWNIAEDKPLSYQRLSILANNHVQFSWLLGRIKNYDKQLFHLNEAIRISEETENKYRLMVATNDLGALYLKLNKPDSALLFSIRAEKIGKELNDKIYYCYILVDLGYIYWKKGNKDLALSYYHLGIERANEQRFLSALARGYLRLCEYYLAESKKDSSLYYAKLFEQTLNSQGRVERENQDIGVAYEKIYQSYLLQGQQDSIKKYAGLTIVAKDSISNYRLQNMAAFQQALLEDQLRLQNIEKEKNEFQNMIRTYILSAGLIVILLIAFLLYRNNRQKHTANLVLQEQKDKVENTLHELKSTQSQLIQSEKMASLGELTAGIAHEIQNPLNFVNNFSEVSTELIDEMNEEIAKGNVDDAKQIAEDLKQNLEKINHHGKRAGDIVKGMLQHSRSSSATKEPTDINKLSDEYFRLAYHGLRAKDKTFNAGMKTDFDDSIGKVNMIPQDIGRVILNLITNAFYVVDEKKKSGIINYEPMVTVTTKNKINKVEISVADNGNGIPKKVMDKIFQPFFTTKPTGQGTGLGLSLSYDIVKAHHGELKVETIEGEGTVFSIILPK
ncbi:ATP-binding protein [Lacibacter sp. H375]|uniref:tetratricopeptide repeat-containing sensor histidine kinase n=1 Tax=Lacibacter sp. H375 TaxID=3133424 RepID=UPI0030C2DD4B